MSSCPWWWASSGCSSSSRGSRATTSSTAWRDFSTLSTASTFSSSSSSSARLSATCSSASPVAASPKPAPRWPKSSPPPPSLPFQTAPSMPSPDLPQPGDKSLHRVYRVKSLHSCWTSNDQHCDCETIELLHLWRLFIRLLLCAICCVECAVMPRSKLDFFTLPATKLWCGKSSLRHNDSYRGLLQWSSATVYP